MSNDSEVVTREILKAELAELKGNLDRRFDSLDQRFESLDQRFESLDQRFEGRMDAQEERLKDFLREAIRDSETRLLQAFYGYAQSADKHMAQLDSESSQLSSRVATLESRVMDLERRLNFPPSHSN